MPRAIGLGVVLFGFWLVLSGHYTPLLIALGVASTVAVVQRSRHMDRVDGDVVPLVSYLRTLPYLPWLLKEILVANVRVAKLLLGSRLSPDPVMMTVKASQVTDFGRFLHANSITLTPGTVTVATDGTNLGVHVLSASMAPPERGGEMDRRVCRVEGSLGIEGEGAEIDSGGRPDSAGDAGA